jgi:hypothetical protein
MIFFLFIDRFRLHIDEIGAYDGDEVGVKHI